MFNPEESFLFIDLNIDIFLKFEFFFLRSIKLSKPSLTFNISANLKTTFLWFERPHQKLYVF